jgi:hypothetical protein
MRGTGTGTPPAARLLEDEARGLLTRLDQITPFVAHETMVLAAALPFPALRAIEGFLHDGRQRLRARVGQYLDWLAGPGQDRPAAEQQRRFVLIRLEFNDVLAQFDVFTEVVTQRSEHRTGVWLSGLDVLAADALTVRAPGMERVPAVCYLARGPGAAIRRARTRLPGGRYNPVAVIRVPRERMVGGGIASSLAHEVGHQGAALLGLVESVRPALQQAAARGGPATQAWQLWERWSSEIIADLWSVARVGVASTLGLMGVVALPRPFVFRRALDEPHPIPWIRVKLSCAMGAELYPHPQWAQLAALWERFYPAQTADAAMRALLALLEAQVRPLVTLLVNHRPPALGGRSIGEALRSADREPARLAALYRRWERVPALAERARPALVFAAVGQAKMDGRITPEQESRALAHLLTYWALRSTIDAREICASAGRRAARAATA